MTTTGLTAKQQTRLLNDLRHTAEKLPAATYPLTFYVMPSTTRNARYIVHNPQQLNALYARLNGGIGIDGQKALQYQSRIVTAIKDNNKYVKSIAGIIGASVPVTQRELAQMEQMGIVKVNGHGAYARIELVK